MRTSARPLATTPTVFGVCGSMLLGALVACGGSGLAQPADSPQSPATSSPAAPAPAVKPFEPTEGERAACGTAKPAPVDDFACLVAARQRAATGDDEGARSLLALGCEQGDLDACLGLRAAALRAHDDARATELLAKVAAACDSLVGDAANLAVCQRARSTDVLRVDGYPASLPFALGLELRAEFGPALLAVRSAAEGGCAEALTTKRAPLLTGTPLAKDARVLDAAIACGAKSFDPDALKSMREGMVLGDTLTPRTLRDGFLWLERSTLRLEAPDGDARIGVYCPSTLVDDDRAADVWLTVPSPKGAVTVVVAVAIDAPCIDASALPAEQAARRVIEAAYAKPRAAIEAALGKLAARCDEDPAGFDSERSPIGDALSSAPSILGFEASCAFGYDGFHFSSTKPVQHPRTMTIGTYVVQAGGHAIWVQTVEEQPDRLELRFRRANAELTIVVKRPE